MTIRTVKSNLPSSFLVLALIILFFGLLLRYTDLLGLPPYVDETQHIWRSQRITAGEVFRGIDQNKWFFSFMGGVLGARGPESLFITRVVSVFSGVVSIATCIALGRMLHSWKAGLIAGALYAFFPLGVFHERQALVDPLMTMFGILSVALSVLLARRPRIWVAVLLMASLSGAYFTKTSGLPYFALPFIAIAIFWKNWQTALKAALMSAAVVGVSLAWRAFIYTQAELTGISPRSTHTAGLENTIFSKLNEPDIRIRFLRDLGLLLELLVKYASPLVVILLLVSILWIIRSKSRRELLYLWYPAVVLLGIGLLSDRPTFWSFPPRYFMNIGPALAVLASVTFMLLIQQLPDTSSQKRWLTSGLVGLVALQGTLFALTAATNPFSPMLHSDDRRSYPGNYRDLVYKQVADVIRAQWEDSGRPTNLIYNGITHQLISTQLGIDVGQGFNSFQHPRELRRELAPLITNGEDFYLAEQVGMEWPPRFSDAIENPYKYSEYMGRFSDPATDIEIDLYHITGFEDGFDDIAYRELVPEPEKLEDFLPPLGAALDAAAPRRVVLFPEDHRPSLRKYTGVPISKLDIEVWPPDPQQTQEAFDFLDLGEEGTPVDFILVEEANIDPGRIILLTLQKNLFYAGDEWYGLHHRLIYYTGPTDPDMQPVNAHFEGNITLQDAAILDETTQPGSAVRLALNWTTENAIGDPFNIFVHLIDQNGNVATQYDNQPGNGLFPMPEWQPGEIIADRIALQLTPDIPPGTYDLYIGIYQPGSGLRLPVIDAPQHGPDYVILGSINIQE